MLADTAALELVYDDGPDVAPPRRVPRPVARPSYAARPFEASFALRRAQVFVIEQLVRVPPAVAGASFAAVQAGVAASDAGEGRRLCLPAAELRRVTSTTPADSGERVVAGTIERLAGVLRSASGHTVATVEIELVMWSRAASAFVLRPVGRGRSASVRAGRKALFFTTGIAVVSYFATEMESYCETGGGVLVR